MSKEKLINSVQEVSWHRNGIGGIGFHAILFKADINPNTEEDAKLWGGEVHAGMKDANWLAIVFDDEGKVAVICLDKIATHGVMFGENSWRGDRFEPELREAIKSHASSGSVRCGPFAMPTGKRENNP